MALHLPDGSEKIAAAAIKEPATTAAALRRLLDSETFRRSDRLRELLTYLVDRAVNMPDSPAKEQEIGAGVYGRNADYDTSHDTIVRVQVAQLRKKLERYYETEGIHEDIQLTIPRGRYLLLWQPGRISVEDLPELEVGPASILAVPGIRKRFRWGVLALTGFGLVALMVLAWWNLRGNQMRTAATPAAPSVAKLWSQLLVPGKTTHVVLSDPGLVLLGIATGSQIRFPELGNRHFLRTVETVPEGAFRSFVEATTAAQLTTLSDVEIVQRVTALGLIDAATINTVVARDFRIRDLNNQNTILIGHIRSNPWVEVFQQSLNFTFDFEAGGMVINNKQPHDGEAKRFLLANPKMANPAQGFATVAFLPNPAATGKTLIISAADVPGTESAIHFLMSETLWEPFFRKIAVNGAVPWFEVVLAYRRLSNSSGNVEPVAWRIIGRK